MFWLFRKNFFLYFLTIFTHELHSYIRIWRSCIEFCEDVVYLGGLSHFLDHFLHFQHCWQMYLVLDCRFFSISIWFPIFLYESHSLLPSSPYTSSFISLFEVLSSSLSLSSSVSSELEYSISLWTLPGTYLLSLLTGLT